VKRRLLVAPPPGDVLLEPAGAPSPYADAHGEADHGLRRGAPLRLVPARAAALDDLYAAGGIPRHVAALRATASSTPTAFRRASAPACASVTRT
jgi:hypothetical protein